MANEDKVVVLWRPKPYQCEAPIYVPRQPTRKIRRKVGSSYVDIQCPQCGSTSRLEHSSVNSTIVCMSCGIVVSENPGELLFFSSDDVDGEDEEVWFAEVEAGENERQPEAKKLRLHKPQGDNADIDRDDDEANSDAVSITKAEPCKEDAKPAAVARQDNEQQHESSSRSPNPRSWCKWCGVGRLYPNPPKYLICQGHKLCASCSGWISGRYQLFQCERCQSVCQDPTSHGSGAVARRLCCSQCRGSVSRGARNNKVDHRLSPPCCSQCGGRTTQSMCPVNNKRWILSTTHKPTCPVHLRTVEASGSFREAGDRAKLDRLLVTELHYKYGGVQIYDMEPVRSSRTRSVRGSMVGSYRIVVGRVECYRSQCIDEFTLQRTFADSTLMVSIDEDNRNAITWKLVFDKRLPSFPFEALILRGEDENIETHQDGNVVDYVHVCSEYHHEGQRWEVMEQDETLLYFAEMDEPVLLPWIPNDHVTGDSERTQSLWHELTARRSDIPLQWLCRHKGIPEAVSKIVLAYVSCRFEPVLELAVERGDLRMKFSFGDGLSVWYHFELVCRRR